MDVSKASGIQNFIPNARKEEQEKKTDLQKQLIQLSKQDDSLARMAQQNSVVSVQNTAEISPIPESVDTVVPDMVQPESTVSQTVAPASRFDEFVKQADQPTHSPSGVYSLKRSEDGKVKIVTEEANIPKAALKEMDHSAEAQKAEESAAKQVEEPIVAADNENAEGKIKGKEDYGTIAEGDFHFECSDPEHQVNPSLHNETECQKVAEAPSVRPATAAEAGMA